jgi:H+/gluconate symporter-like permease
LSLILLVVVLVVAIWRRMNIGVLALAAALPVLFLSGLDPKVMYQTFPGDLFVLIAGVSALFAHLERSGALARVVEKVYATVGERQALLPWTGFLLAALLSTAGAFSTAPIAFLVPMVAHVGVRYRASFYLCELAVVIGANSAGLSPLNPTGATVRAAATKLHVDYSSWGLWAVSMVVAVTVVLVLQVLNACSGSAAGRSSSSRPPRPPATTNAQRPPTMTIPQRPPAWTTLQQPPAWTARAAAPPRRPTGPTCGAPGWASWRSCCSWWSPRRTWG